MRRFFPSAKFYAVSENFRNSTLFGTIDELNVIFPKNYENISNISGLHLQTVTLRHSSNFTSPKTQRLEV